MDPAVDAFIPGQEYEIPSSWGNAFSQQLNGRNTTMPPAPSVDDYSYLPPVIHRFQTPQTRPMATSQGGNSSSGTKDETPNASSLLDAKPEAWTNQQISTNPSVVEPLAENRPFRVVTRSKPPRSKGQSPPKSTQAIKPMNDFRRDESASNGSEVNEHLTEKFGRGNAFKEDGRSSSPPRPRMIMKLNPAIRKYQEIADSQRDESHWTGFREVPASAEVWSDGRKGHDEPVEIDTNVVAGPYSSMNDYLERHYMLLREDAVAPLRNAISEVQANPHMLEKDSREDVYIYERMYITGFTFANSGIAARVSFSLKRVGKRVNWEQSKRLRTGSIVALTPAKDGFRSVCRIAFVAARPMAGLEQNPPEIDILFGSSDEIELDPQVEWIMVESRNGFYEGHRHTLRGLQMLAKEASSGSLEQTVFNPASVLNHIVYLDEDIGAPLYVEQQPLKDLRPVFPENEEMGGGVLETDILGEWPRLPSHLDESQLAALKRILTKRLAIVQGPPGTGKTFVSVAAINLMLHNMEASDPPIIIAAHTNHAVDQLLRHVSQFEPEFIRIGAMTTDVEIIKPRTLYEVKQAVKANRMPGGLYTAARVQLKKLTADLKATLGPLTYSKEVFPALLFKHYNVISEAQYTSLINGAKDWINADGGSSIEEVVLWLGEEKIEAERRITPEDFGVNVEYEEVDLEFEQLKEIEAESRVLDDDTDFETLRGERSLLKEPWVGRKASGMSDQPDKELLAKKDLWEIPVNRRGAVYNSMAKLLKDAIRSEFRLKAQKYAEVAQNMKVGKWEVDYNYLKRARIIGMTTTGLSKYRGLIQSLGPKVILIEEAAEVLEGFVSVACMESIEHLILVGDHQQLRGRVNDQGLEGNPFYLDVSMFERLVRNNIEFTQLRRQRRMIPEIRRALQTIYEDLEDHESVHDRASIPGMGEFNSFFFTHKSREENDAQMSKVNFAEADLIVAFYVYLKQNGTAPKDITVLTYYNGQRKLILRKLREQPMLRGEKFKVVTVDSYQGEENEVVLLSLVRCNEHRRIGFLSIENRVCVAISRAKRGFYIFGDAENLCKSSMLWWDVVRAMAKRPCRVGFHLPLTCTNHGNMTFVEGAKDMANLSGGCSSTVCREELACGHVCTLNCHPFSHDFYGCPKRCTRLLPCGHQCAEICSADCKANCACEDNGIEDGIDNEEAVGALHKASSSKHPSSTPVNGETEKPMWDFTKWSDPAPSEFASQAKAFNEFAQGGHAESDRALVERHKEAVAKENRERRDMEQFEALFGGPSKPPKDEQRKGLKVLRVTVDENGATRTRYQEKYKTPQPEVKRSLEKKKSVDLLEL